MSRDFLSRWSQRKLERRDAVTDTPGEPVAASGDPVAPEELSSEEIAALPPVESLTGESDIAGFLRKGVPQVLRNAALRRAWALDPEIRDYVGDARDYAYDWNVAGGVPGTGPLDPGTDVAQMVEDIFGREREPEPVRAGGEPQAAECERRDELRPSPDCDTASANPIELAAGDGDAPTAPLPGASTSRDPASVAPKTRHGGAKPA
jgi:hypothetical protein